MSWSSFGTLTSGLKAAQLGLSVTGHNISNSLATGYTRQRIIQSDFSYVKIGSSFSSSMQLGFGTNVDATQQIRNTFLDRRYRDEVMRLGFYNSKLETGNEMQIILGELYNEGRAGNVIQDIFDSLHELSGYPSSFDTRSNFLSNAISFLNRADNVYERLLNEQRNLDNQVREAVDEINNLMKEIDSYNNIIMLAEISGQKANDFRDARNVLLDRLSELLSVEIYENPNGRVDIFTEGAELLVNGNINNIGLKFCAEGYSFVEPVFTNSQDILPFDAPSGSFRLLFSLTGSYSAQNNNDRGMLKGLLVSRGIKPANYRSPDPATRPDAADYPLGTQDPQYREDLFNYEREVFNANEALIPKAMKEFDKIVNSIVVSINDSISPYLADGSMDFENAPYALDGSQFREVFVRKHVDRFDGADMLNPEDPNDYYSLYSIGNIEINPELLLDNSLLPYSLSRDLDDQRVILDVIIDKMSNGFTAVNGIEYGIPISEYRLFIEGIAVDTNDSEGFMEGQMTLALELDNYRMQTSGVSLDEEMSNMMRYYYAYNSASRLVTVIDSMIDRVVNGTGRAGL